MSFSFVKLFGCLTVLGSFLLSGCTVTKDFSMPLEVDYFVNSGTSSVSLLDTLDASSESSDYGKYKEDIKSVDIESATFTISQITPFPTTAVVTSATLEVGDMNGTVMKKIAEVSNVDLQTANGVETPLPLTAEGKDYFKSLMSGDGKAIVKLTATANQEGISFNVLFKFKTKVTFEKTLP